jgi:hypothetical protein
MSRARDLASIFNLATLSGTTAERPATADIGTIYYNGTTAKTQIYTATGWQDMASGIPYGADAGRPANPVIGQPYFNGETQRLEIYTVTGWNNIVQETPGVSSISGNYSEQTNSGTIAIAGTNFVSGCYATAIGSNGVQVEATSTTFNSIVQVTATFTGLSNQYEPYDIKVTNPSNLFGILPDALYINASPVWQTASGSLGTFVEQVSISLSATATDSDSTITYSLASGSSLPSGVTLNSSTGAITGTLPNIETTTTYTFTINASDGLNTIPRTFNFISEAKISQVEYLVVAGGGSGAGDYGGGGGAGGLKTGLLSVLPSTNYSISIGTGGSGSTGGTVRGNNGTGSTFASISTSGGGGGGAEGNHAGLSGGSGGGSSYAAASASAGSGVSGEGNSGGSTINGYTSPSYPAAGGGGAGGAGLTPANSSTGGVGGAGVQSSITGTSLFYAAGGGGGSETVGTGGVGGSSIGGNGGSGGSNNGTSGAANTGSGGGGGRGDAGVGGSGANGVVVIAYPSSFAAPTISAGLTYDQPSRSGYRVYRFTSGSGTITF